MLDFCGLNINERHILSEICRTLKETKDWSDQMVDLTKWFKKDKDDGDVDVVFHKYLLKDIAKPRFSYVETPTVGTTHRGILHWRFC